MKKKVIFSGMRPTGKLHIGHWVGALSNWVRLQDDYQCYFSVVDWHALMSEYKDPSKINAYVFDNVCDWLAWGIDPQKSTVFIQSQVSEHLDLFLILSCLTPLGWLFRCPTFKEQMQQLKEKEVNTYAFLGYPVLQAADILLYKADCVPVGEDQLPHLELAREIVRRFHFLYKKEVFREPQSLLTSSPRLLGLDGRKMSKSYENAIFLDEEEAALEKKVLSMVTDPARQKRQDPGHPEICNVHAYFEVFNPERKEEVEEWCRNARKGCFECKKILAGILNDLISPHREKKREFLKQKAYIYDILKDGKSRAHDIASATMEEIKRIMQP
jgi:tryptophanyl-tRNA synthetase